ncbi:MAG: HEPN domain-containing protein [Phycisphaerales bacterium]|nr:HEPN domain-containing protein [Phycisphaerales bacterium]
MPPSPSAVREWLEKAQRDLRLAHLAFEDQPPIFDGGCFHCQQAAEKALKGLLELHAMTVPKVHGLGPLLDLCGAFTDRLRSLRPDLLALNYYAVAIRYPASKDPTAEDAENALRTAEKLLETVLDLVPQDARP